MASTTDKIKHALQMDKSTTTSTHHNGVPGEHTAGYAGTGTTGTHTGTHTGTGAGIGAGVGSGIGSTHTGAHTGVGHSTAGAGYGNNTSTTTAPHSSSIANKIDPRVDTTTGAYGSTGTTGSTHTGTHTGVGHSTTGAGYGNNTSTTTAPHSSSIANKIDPRVSTGTTGTHTGHSTTGGYGTTGTTGTHNGHTTTGTGAGYNSGISHSTNAGPHHSNIANKVDPTVDSDRDGRGPLQHAIGGNGSHATPGSGKAQNTAGPHNSDLLNKLDPRVDSDLSGGKTFGGNKTNA